MSEQAGSVMYSVRKWPLGNHYWVTFFGDLELLPKGTRIMYRLETSQAAQDLIKNIRRRMPEGVRLYMKGRKRRE